MSFKKTAGLFLIIMMGYFTFAAADEVESSEDIHNLCIAESNHTPSLAESAIARELGWVTSDLNRCGGYYLEPAFIPPNTLLANDLIHVTGDQGVFSLHGTSIYQGNVTITQNGQQVIANRAYVYREPATEKYSAIDLIGNVILREPNDLILAKCGRLDLTTKNKSLYDILYRTAIYGQYSVKPVPPTNLIIEKELKVFQLSAWGQAHAFKQIDPKIYEFERATYSTCPPMATVWQVRAREIVLNKNTGRGVAKHARLYLKNVPVFYTPYLNFPIDDRRQTGFLWPSIGTSGQSGGYITTPFYWNLAPNYDDTITPTMMSKRGLQITNLYRYLTTKGQGELSFTVLPHDREFAEFKESQEDDNVDTTNPVTQSELRRLEDSSLTRKAVTWLDKTRFNEHWSSDVNFNYVGDDYYLKDFRNNLTETTPNQLLQEGDLNYKSQYWQGLVRVQAYQTLHPIDETQFNNQYMRLPQLALQGDYLDDKTGLEFFIYNDATHFDIRNNPGIPTEMPIGNRAHTQPGISWPYYRPYFYFIPRLQFAATQYTLQQVPDVNPADPGRELPIFDIHSGLYFDRNVTFLSHVLRQTLEPQVYYTYVPYRNQDNIPVFDTTVNTLTYDQLFTYNRFSGLDRIGDANQVSIGVTTRFIDEETGYEKIRAGLGEILYFRDRLVTLCYNPGCSDQPLPDENTEPRSPLSGMLLYNLTPSWSLSANTIWDSNTRELDNQTVSVQYMSDIRHIVSLTYSYVRNGDPQFDDNGQIDEGNSANNLNQTDLSFTWPLTRDWSSIARWTQSWNQGHFQNLLYGLQYDSCCWAIRMVAGRIFTNQTPENTFQYNTEFYIQFALKGLGNFGTGNPGHLVNSTVIANKTYFGQDY